MTLQQSIGGQATGGMHSLLGYRTIDGLGAGPGDALAYRRIEMQIGYGMPAFGGGFTSTPELGIALSQASREYRAGWRLGLARSSSSSVEFTLEATRHEGAGDSVPEHGVGLGLIARW